MFGRIWGSNHQPRHRPLLRLVFGAERLLKVPAIQAQDLRFPLAITFSIIGVNPVERITSGSVLPTRMLLPRSGRM